MTRLFYPTTAKEGGDKFPIFTILVGFLHSSGVVGQNARDALLLCMSMSKKHHKIGKHIATNTNFCPVISVVVLLSISKFDQGVGQGGQGSPPLIFGSI